MNIEDLWADVEDLKREDNPGDAIYIIALEALGYIYENESRELAKSYQNELNKHFVDRAKINIV